MNLRSNVYLTSDECQKYRKCYENQEDIKCLAKCFQLEMLNNCRKEIIDGNSVIVLSGEEQEALNNAMGENNIAK